MNPSRRRKPSFSTLAAASVVLLVHQSQPAPAAQPAPPPQGIWTVELLAPTPTPTAEDLFEDGEIVESHEPGAGADGPVERNGQRPRCMLGSGTHGSAEPIKLNEKQVIL